MDRTQLQHRETLLLEALLSGLDARESARRAAAPMLLYLAELLVKRAREELEEVQLAIDGLGRPAGSRATPDGTADRDFA